ncbi:MAG: CoA-binding protein [Deltaproteobacteria bacterium]|nr:CoA-binding protein [Candidatus Zymogenaceae bacterium]
MIDLNPLFYPESVAVIGASPNVIRDRGGFFNSLRLRYSGRLYAVNPKYDEIHGVACYPSIKDIKDRIDYALIMVPNTAVLPVLTECVEAKARFVLIFTSGFSEAGNDELENRLKEVLQGGETRVIGPNCIGVHCPESGVIYYPEMAGAIPGTIGYFSQSGGHALNFLLRGISMELEFNKVASIGNQMDLKVEDYLEYFASDDRVKVICGYVEDIKDGKRFKKLVSKTLLEAKKPLVIWKGGRSEAGARATESHTGAITSPIKVWDAVMDQLGVISAENQEELADILLAFKCGFLPSGMNTCIAVAGGGSSVELTDGASMNGLSVPPIAEDIQEIIARDISSVNTSTKNPIDLGMFGFAPNIFVNAAVEAAKDPNIDIIMVCQYPEMIKTMVKDLWEASVTMIVEGLQTVDKPVVMIIPRLFQNNAETEAARGEFVHRLTRAGIPSYPTAERAARVAVKLIRYRRFLESKGVTLPKRGAA